MGVVIKIANIICFLKSCLLILKHPSMFSACTAPNAVSCDCQGALDCVPGYFLNVTKRICERKSDGKQTNKIQTQIYHQTQIQKKNQTQITQLHIFAAVQNSWAKANKMTSLLLESMSMNIDITLIFHVMCGVSTSFASRFVEDCDWWNASYKYGVNRIPSYGCLCIG